jgi:hypothetical protein
MAPIVLQWRGEGPDGSASSRIRGLMQIQEEKFPNTAKNLYREQLKSAKNTRSLQETDELRELQELDLKHVVTFKECVFKVSLG